MSASPREAQKNPAGGPSACRLFRRLRPRCPAAQVSRPALRARRRPHRETWTETRVIAGLEHYL